VLGRTPTLFCGAQELSYYGERGATRKLAFMPSERCRRKTGVRRSYRGIRPLV